MKLILALAVALSVSAAAHAQQYKEVPVKSYVLTDPDGTPRYLVREFDQSPYRQVYHIKQAKPGESSARQSGETSRRAAPKKRFIWPTEIM